MKCKVLTTQINHLVSLVKWLSVRLQSKALWVRVSLQSFTALDFILKTNPSRSYW